MALTRPPAPGTSPLPGRVRSPGPPRARATGAARPPPTDSPGRAGARSARPRRGRAAPALRRGARPLAKCPQALQSRNATGPVWGPVKALERLRALRQNDVLRLQALVALLDVELNALSLGQGAVAVHLDGAVVDEDVVALLTLDESVALLVREPLDGALSQLLPPSQQTTARQRPPCPFVHRTVRGESRVASPAGEGK